MTGKVLLLANNFPPVRGGSAVVYDNIASASCGRIDVLAPRIGYADGLPLIGWREHDRRAPYRVHRLRLLRTVLASSAPSSPAQRARLLANDLAIRLQLWFAILRLVRRERVRAVCLGELVASGWLIRPLRRLLGLRVIVYIHGEEITTDDPYDPGKRRCRQRLLEADGIIVVSRFTETVIHDLMGQVPSEKVMLVSNGVAAKFFTPGPKRADLLAQYGLDGGFVYVSVCRLLEKKGVDNALRAFATLTGPQAARSRFLVVGSGPHQPVLMDLAQQLGVADRVAFTGLVSEHDLIDFYRLGDVFVMPNRRLPNGDTEGFGLVFLEANGCGLPVIAGRDGGSTDAVQDGVNGLVVDGNSVQEIADAMQRLRDDAPLRAQLRQNGLACAAEAGWERKTEIFLSFCAGTVDAGR
ncbi:MAG TPA: glycosyltransferase family 4 protein [Acetobacteraceae bacterium]|nr:glycosyltransferase family 4 protein [Acetobacteraceae bacterium]